MLSNLVLKNNKYMSRRNIYVYDKHTMYLNSLEEMAIESYLDLYFIKIDDLNYKEITSKRKHILWIVYDVEDFYKLLMYKINFKKVIIATKNKFILNYLYDTFNLNYVDLNLKKKVINSIYKSILKK